ncbi:MAG: EutP/PduV family microcompartment system protein [Fusobacterium sp.]|nr:EutP/PduV family microcompartment system protein [Fusobacterium sp.]
MKKIMLIGRTGSGKTTLTQRLNGETVAYRKTQAVSYKSRIIDTPGEYVETKVFYRSLLVLSADAKYIVMIQAANDEDTIFPPKFSSMFPRKEIIGVVTKADINSDTARSERILLEAGASEVFKIGLEDEEGLKILKKRLGLDES